MSGYDYASRSGYTDHIGKPVSIVSYDVVHGPRTYVKRIEERVCRPSVIGYAYSSSMKTGEETRPGEVDNFITKILDEVNGSSVSTTRQVDPASDYGAAYTIGNDSPKKVDVGRGYYEIEYTYVGSPTGSQISRRYGDPFDQLGLSSHNYGSPKKPSDNSLMWAQTRRDHDVPENRWERSSCPNYDVSPYNPSPAGSHGSNSYEVKPGSPRDNVALANRWDKQSSPIYGRSSPRDYGVPNNYEARSESPRENGVPNNRWEKQPIPMNDHPPQRDYGTPYNHGINSSVKPESPKASEGSGNHWSRSSNPTYGQPQSNSQPDNSPIKLQTPKGYGDPGNQWSRPSKPTYDQAPTGMSADIRQSGNSPVKPISSDGYGIPNNQKGTDHQLGNPSVKPQSPQGYGVSDNLGGRSSSPLGSPQSYSSKKPQSPKGYYGVPENQKGGFATPDYEHPPRNDIFGGVPKTQLGNSPLKTESPRDQGARKDNQWEVPKGTSTSPEYEHPPRYEIVAPSLKVKIPQNDGNRSNTPLNAQSPLDHGSPGNRWGSPSSPAYEQSLPNTFSGLKLEQPNAAVRSGVPGFGNKLNATNNTYGNKPKGHNYSQANKPVGHSYD